MNLFNEHDYIILRLLFLGGFIEFSLLPYGLFYDELLDKLRISGESMDEW